MCGIFLVYSREGRLVEPDRFMQALGLMSNRGPDDFGYWNDANAQIGQRRLSIVDLSPAGHQPMHSADGRYVITFNGEIYNHQELRADLAPVAGWRGTSDTETLLESYAAWGINCLNRLEGMFAFAIWDRRDRRVFAARDRVGLKPLYYHWQDGALLLASRPSPLISLTGPSTIDRQALRLYLELGYIPAPLSLHECIRKLRPGHYLLADSLGLSVSRYWDYRHITTDESLLHRREEDLVEELDTLIQQGVKRRLLSDVPLGAFLSGGTDSALVVAAMKTCGVEHPQTFTIGFRESRYDESAAASRIASHLGVENTHEILSIEDLLQLLPQYVAEFDEPLADNSAFATMAVARLARRHVTVALTGDGGDELFGGYPQYRLFQRLGPALDLPLRSRQLLSRVLNRLPWHNGKRLAGALRSSDLVNLFAYLRSLSKDFAQTLGTEMLVGTEGVADWFQYYATSFATDISTAETAMRLDIGFTLPDDYLQKVDVATMAFSLEARCPLIDHHLVEWAMRLPTRLKVRDGCSKYLLRKVLCRYLPRDMIYQPKKGFGVPVGDWIRGPLRGWAAQLLHESAAMDCLPLRHDTVRSLFAEHVSGRRNAAPLLWAILMLICFISREDRRFGLPDIGRLQAA